MNEKLLQFIWQHQYFNHCSLSTGELDHLEIHSPGKLNSDQGPDFSSARISINGQRWAGNIEVHVNSSDWFLHGHDEDENYNRVILHVVWNNDHPGASAIPLLELQPRVPKHLINTYQKWMNNTRFIPCENNIRNVDHAVLYSWFDWLASQRVRRKSMAAMDRVRALNMNWEEAFWQAIARSFGHRVNADAFERIASSIPITLLMRHANNIVQIEALLIGQAGLLRIDNADEYPKMLQREYNFLRKKYNLVKLQEPVHFLRMRPVNFPTIRLAQLAALIYNNGNFFARITSAVDADAIMKILRVTANDYWHYRFRFGEPSTFQEKTTGDQLINSIMMNTVIPFLHAYHMHIGKTEEADKYGSWLSLISMERNAVTYGFTRLGVATRNASDTQALLECKMNFCESLRCLECGIGRNLLKQSTFVAS